MRLLHNTALTFAVAAFGTALCLFVPGAIAGEEVDRVNKLLPDIKPSGALPDELKAFDASKQIGVRTDADIRKQKKDAADSLNNTLKDIDERARTRAIEDGRAVIVQ